MVKALEKQASDCFGKGLTCGSTSALSMSLKPRKAELRALETKERLNESWECLEALGDRLSDPSGAVRNSFNLPHHTAMCKEIARSNWESWHYKDCLLNALRKLDIT